MKPKRTHMYGLRGTVRCGKNVHDVAWTAVPEEVTCGGCLRVMARAERLKNVVLA